MNVSSNNDKFYKTKAVSGNQMLAGLNAILKLQVEPHIVSVIEARHLRYFVAPPPPPRGAGFRVLMRLTNEDESESMRLSVWRGAYNLMTVRRTYEFIGYCALRRADDIGAYVKASVNERRRPAAAVVAMPTYGTGQHVVSINMLAAMTLTAFTFSCAVVLSSCNVPVPELL